MGRKATSGLWITATGLRKQDRRKRPAKAMQAIQDALWQALGNDLTPQQQILVDRVAFLVVRIAAFEALWLSGAEYAASVDGVYLGWVGSLGRTLSLLGLERRSREVFDVVAELAKMADEDRDK